MESKNSAKPLLCGELLQHLLPNDNTSMIRAERLLVEVFSRVDVLQRSFLPSSTKSNGSRARDCVKERTDAEAEEEEKDEDEKEVREKSEMEVSEKDMFQPGCCLSEEELHSLSKCSLGRKIASKVAASLDLAGLQSIFKERGRLPGIYILTLEREQFQSFQSRLLSLWEAEIYNELAENRRDIVACRSLYLCVWLFGLLEKPLVRAAETYNTFWSFRGLSNLPIHLQAALCFLWRDYSAHLHTSGKLGPLAAQLCAALRLAQKSLLRCFNDRNVTATCTSSGADKIRQQLYCVPASGEIRGILSFLELLHVASIFCGKWPSTGSTNRSQNVEEGNDFLGEDSEEDDSDTGDSDSTSEKPMFGMRRQRHASRESLYHFGCPVGLLRLLGIQDMRECHKPLIPIEEFCDPGVTEMLERWLKDPQRPMNRTSWWQPRQHLETSSTERPRNRPTTDIAGASSSSQRNRLGFAMDSEEENEDVEEHMMEVEAVPEDSEELSHVSTRSSTRVSADYVQLLDFPYLVSMEHRVHFLQIRSKLVRKTRREPPLGGDSPLASQYLRAASMLHSLLTETEFDVRRRGMPSSAVTPLQDTATTSSGAASSSSSSDAFQHLRFMNDSRRRFEMSRHNPMTRLQHLLQLQDPQSSVERGHGSSGSAGATTSSSSGSSSMGVLPVLPPSQPHRLLHVLAASPLMHLPDYRSLQQQFGRWEHFSTDSDEDSEDDDSDGSSGGEGASNITLRSLRAARRRRQSGGAGVVLHETTPRASHWTFTVDREHLTESFLTQLATLLETRNNQLLSRPLKIQFNGEPGMDQGGGLTKEFFHLIFEQMFKPDFGLFTWHDDASVYWLTCYESPFSEHLVEYKYVGVLVALCVYHAIPLNVSLPQVFFHKLLGRRATALHLSEVYRDLSRGLTAMLHHGEGDGEEEIDFQDVYYHTFKVAQVDTFGGMFHHELIPDGGRTQVTVHNMHEYVDAYADYLLNKSVERQFGELQRGWNLVMEGKCYDQLLLPRELQRILFYKETVCVESLRQHTVYSDFYHEAHPNICAFWSVVQHRLTEEEHLLLLQFVTASRRLPLGGYRRLKFTIVPAGGEDDRPPSAHTCFNTLILPNYTSEEELCKYLRIAIQHNQGFGLT